MKKRVFLVMLVGSLWGCITGIHHPPLGYFFINQEPLFSYSLELLPNGEGTKTNSTPTDHFGVMPVFLNVGREANAFNYWINADFLVAKDHERVTIHEVVIIVDETEYQLSSQEPEVYSLQPLASWTLRAEDGRWYARVRYSDEEQKKRLTDGKWISKVTIIPIVNLIKVFKKMNVTVTTDSKIDIRITYQLDDEEIVSYTNKYVIRIEDGYMPLFGR